MAETIVLAPVGSVLPEEFETLVLKDGSLWDRVREWKTQRNVILVSAQELRLLAENAGLLGIKPLALLHIPGGAYSHYWSNYSGLMPAATLETLAQLVDSTQSGETRAEEVVPDGEDHVYR